MHGAMLVMSNNRRRIVTLGVMTGMLLAAIEGTVVGTAMPTIVAALGGLAHYSWVFSAYLLTSTVTVPVWGSSRTCSAAVSCSRPASACSWSGPWRAVSRRA